MPLILHPCASQGNLATVTWPKFPVFSCQVGKTKQNKKKDLYIHAEILPPLLLSVLIMDLLLLLSVSSNLLDSNLPLRDILWSKAKVNQERKHKEMIKSMHYLTFSNWTNDLKSTWTHTLLFWNTCNLNTPLLTLFSM